MSAVELLQSRQPAGAADRSPSVGLSQVAAAADSFSDDSVQQARRVDQLSRRYFPLAFFCINVVYWLIYTQGSQRLL